MVSWSRPGTLQEEAKQRAKIQERKRELAERLTDEVAYLKRKEAAAKKDRDYASK